MPKYLPNDTLQNDPSSLYFSAIMSVCLSLLQPLGARKELLDLGIDENVASERITLLYG